MNLKKLSKNIPEYLKEERGVFEYLKRESWIFDYSFLLDIVKNNVISKHRKRLRGECGQFFGLVRSV
jgi:hypothetical protein